MEVDDGAKTGTTTIEVSVTSVNDDTPAWSTIPSSAISVNENTAIGTSISSVTAADVDYGDHGTITYSIVTVAGDDSSDGASLFSIDPSDGDVRYLKNITVYFNIAIVIDCRTNLKHCLQIIHISSGQ